MFVFFLNLSRFTLLSLRHRTNSVGDALAQQLPAVAQRLRGPQLETVPLHQLQPGDTVLVRAGDVVPVDGVIVDGTTQINEAWLSGESLPVPRTGGDAVSCGSINAGSPIQVRALATAQSTSLAGIAELVQQAQLQKPMALQVADRFARVFLRCVVATSLLVFAAWLVIDSSRALPALLAMLIVACPCAFSIAMPAVLSAATAELSRRGVLMTRADALETLAKAGHVIFDKTGTLTRGNVTLQRCRSLGSLPMDECLTIAAALEHSSAHPLAAAFAKPLANIAAAERVTTQVGCGIEGDVSGVRYRIGTPAFVQGLCNEALGAGVAESIVLGNAHGLLAAFEVSDALREDSSSAIAGLQQLGMDTEILSGDSAKAVAGIARSCAIQRSTARCLPADKVTRVRELQHGGNVAVMVGDGINDAPVLAAADVSIAMGRGAALALASADCIIMSERLGLLPALVAVARKSVRIARQNLIWSAAYNLIALPLAALGFIPPWGAAVGMSLSSILVVLNSLRMLAASRFTSSAPLQAPTPSPPLIDSISEDMQWKYSSPSYR